MEFDCPACQTPHAFPDDQIPAAGIVVACTRCGEHISLEKPVATEAQRVAPPPPAPRPSPPSPRHSRPPDDASEERSAIIPIPDPDDEPRVASGRKSIHRRTSDRPKPKQQPSRTIPAPSPAMDRPVMKVPSPSKPPPPAEESVVEKAAGAVASAAKGAVDAGFGVLDEASRAEIRAEDDVPAGLAFPGFEPTADGAYTWRDLPRAFMGIMDVKRVAFTTACFFAALVTFGLMGWLGGLLGSKVWGPLGTVFTVAGGLAAVALAAAATSVMGYVCHQTIVEQRPTTIDKGVSWTKQWLKSVVGTPLAFLGVILAIGVAEAIFGLIARIPFVGPIVWGVASPAIFFGSFVAGLVLLALMYSLPLYIPVIYNEQTGPKQTLTRLLGLYREHGASLVAYVLLSILMITFACIVTLYPAATVGSLFTAGVGAKASGGEIFLLAAAIPSDLAGLVMAGAGMGGAGEGVAYKIGGIFTGLGVAAMLAFAMALLALPYYTAGGIIYAIVTGRKKPG